jgi:fibronectin-binding autotransporter adhesin
LIKNGTGILTLSGTNTYTGQTTISAGTLDISGILGSGNYSGAISNSVLIHQIIIKFYQELSGTGSLTKSGSGKLSLWF